MSRTEKNTEPLDAILRNAMREQPGAATPECADAESLAAYWDKSISAANRERLEAHLAGCARCMTQLTAIARAVESAGNAKSASEVPWYRRWRVAIPAIAAAAAVVVMIAMWRPATEEANSDQLVAMAKREAPAIQLAEQAAAPAPPAKVNAPASPPAAAPSLLAMNEARRETKERRQAPAIELAAKPPPLAPAVPAGAPTGPVSIAAASASNEIAMNEAKMAAPAVAAANAGAPRFGGTVAGGSAGAGGAVSSLEQTPEQPGVTISAPDQSVSWIVGKNGMVQRRNADGSTHIQRSGVSTDLVAGAALSATVCWIVGNSGTIIRTTDGEHWELVAGPTTENLTAVSASSASNATITTASGQSFATSDGGASWHPR